MAFETLPVQVLKSVALCETAWRRRRTVEPGTASDGLYDAGGAAQVGIRAARDVMRMRPGALAPIAVEGVAGT